MPKKLILVAALHFGGLGMVLFPAKVKGAILFFLGSLPFRVLDVTAVVMLLVGSGIFFCALYEVIMAPAKKSAAIEIPGKKENKKDLLGGGKDNGLSIGDK